MNISKENLIDTISYPFQNIGAKAEILEKSKNWEMIVYATRHLTPEIQNLCKFYCINIDCLVRMKYKAETELKK